MDEAVSGDRIWYYGLAVFMTAVGLSGYFGAENRSSWLTGFLGFLWGACVSIQWYVALHPRPTKPIDPQRLIAICDVITVGSTVVVVIGLASVAVLLCMHYVVHIL